MGLESGFFERNPWAIRQMLPAVNMTENMTPQPLTKGYYGHEGGCDCAVCDDVAFRQSLRGKPYMEPAAMELLRQKVEKFESALKKIARGTLEPGHVYLQAVRMQDIAREALADRP